MRSQLSKPSARAAHKAGARMRLAHALIHPPSDIPDKLYFKIGEVAKLCGVETYVLRFWESEFPQLRPTKSGTGQRLYRKRDVEMALRIRRLLYEEGFTIPGARQTLQQEARGLQGGREKQSELPLEPQPALRAVVPPSAPASAPLKVEELRTELQAILGLLQSPVGKPRLVSKELKTNGGPQAFTD